MVIVLLNTVTYSQWVVEKELDHGIENGYLFTVAESIGEINYKDELHTP